MKKNQNGFGPIGILVAILFAVVIGGVAYTVYQRNNKTEETKSSQTSQSTEAELNAQKDAERKEDINKIHDMLGGFYAYKGFYPTSTQLSDEAWIKENTKDIKILVASGDNLKDPHGLYIGTKNSEYIYSPRPGGCESATNACKEYLLSVKLSDGTFYERYNLN